MNNKNTLQTVFIFGFFILLFALILKMLNPFFSVILWTVLLYILIKPLYVKVHKKLNPAKKFYKFKENCLAATFAIGTLVLIVGSMTVLIILLVKQGIDVLDKAKSLIQKSNYDTNFLIEKITEIGQFLNIKDLKIESFSSKILGFIESFSAKLLGFSKTFVGKTGNFAISLVFIIFALYFCFLDGNYLAKLLKKAIPINSIHMDVLTKKFSVITKNLFSGYILVALYQGLAAFIIFLCFGVDGSLFLAVLLMFATFIPIFGAAIVWLPVGIVICATDSLVKGIFFLLISGFCISFLDNFLRPFFLKDRINLHPLVIFFSILGGLKVFGLNGLILGPLIIILFFTVLNLIISSKTESEENFSTENTSDLIEENKNELEVD